MLFMGKFGAAVAWSKKVFGFDRSQRDRWVDFFKGAAFIGMFLAHYNQRINRNSYAYEGIFNSFRDITESNIWEFVVRTSISLSVPAMYFFMVGYLMGVHFRPGDTRQISSRIVRGLLIFCIDFFVVRFLWNFPPGYLPAPEWTTPLGAIGLGMVFLSVLIYLPPSFLLAVAAVIPVAMELIGVNFSGPDVLGSNFNALFWSGGFSPYFKVKLPVIPWMSFLLVGTFVARKKRDMDVRECFVAAAAGFLLFCLLRIGLDWGHLGFTNKVGPYFFLLRKYPPSLQYMIFGLSCVFLFCGLSRVAVRHVGGLSRCVEVFGKESLFLFVSHVLLIAVIDWMFDLRKFERADVLFSVITLPIVLGLQFLALVLWVQFRQVFSKGRLDE